MIIFRVGSVKDHPQSSKDVLGMLFRGRTVPMRDGGTSFLPCAGPSMGTKIFFVLNRLPEATKTTWACYGTGDQRKKAADTIGELAFMKGPKLVFVKIIK
jgi:hypothetical protein